MSGHDFERYAADPFAFADEVARVHLWSKQRELVDAIQTHHRVAACAANSIGKTFVVAFGIQHHLARGPGSVAVATSATDGQLRRVLWRELRRQVKRSGPFFRGAVVTDNEVRLADDWFAVGFATDVPEALAGIHAERILVVVDEASGVDEAMFDAIEGLMAGGDARLLLVGNPLRTSGTFFDAFNSRRDEFHTLTISALDSPNLTGEKVPPEVGGRLVSRRWVENFRRRGEASNAYRVRVLAEFPNSADDSVVALADLEQAHAQSLEPDLPLVLGVDIARFGSDETVVALREGRRVRVKDSWNGRDLMQTSGRVAALAQRIHGERGRRVRIVVDDAGVGGGVTDRLREQGFDVTAFNAAGRARRPRDYPNRRSELWFTTAEALPLLDLDPADEELSRELLAPTYSFDSTGARVVEPKANTRKRLRRSPDKADAVLLTLALDPPLVPGRARPRRHATWSNPAKLRRPTPLPRAVPEAPIARIDPTLLTRRRTRIIAPRVQHDPLAELARTAGITVRPDLGGDGR